MRASTCSNRANKSNRSTGGSTRAQDVDVSYSKNTMKLQASARTRPEEEMFRQLMDNAPMMIRTAGPDAFSTYFNRAWLDFAGPQLERGSWQSWEAGIHPEDRPGWLAAHAKAWEEQSKCRTEYRYLRHDGQFRWLVDQLEPRFDTAGQFNGYVGFTVDITESKANEQAVLELGGQLINAQEAERARIARELHDSVGQRVAMLSIDAELIKLGLTSSQSDLRQQLDNLCALTGELARDIRRLSHGLHSAMLDHVGLVAATYDLCGQVARQNGISIETLDRNLPDTIAPDASLGLFRVLQECLTNLVKHSQASSARVVLEADENNLRLLVSDAGVGFDVSSRKSGLGFISIKERLRLLGGRLSIRSAPNAGTQILAEVPLARVASVPANSMTGGLYAQTACALG